MKKLARKGLALGLSFLMFASTAYSDLSLIAHAEEEHHVWTKVSLNDISENDSIAITMTTSDGTTYVLPNAKATNAVPNAKIGTVDGNTLVMNEGDDAGYAWKLTKYTVEEAVVADAVNNAEADVVAEDKTELVDLEEETEEVSSLKSTEEKTLDTVDVNASVEEEKTVVSDDAKNTAEPAVVKNTRVYYTITNPNGGSALFCNKANKKYDVVRIKELSKNPEGYQWEVSGNYLKTIDGNRKDRFLGVVSNAWCAYYSTDSNIKGQTLAFYKLTNKVAGSATEDTVAAPEASVESGAVDFGTKVELRCSTENAQIYYTINGRDDIAKLYEAPIEITGTTTITAYAEKDGKQSLETPLTYTLAEGTKITDFTKLSDDQEFVLVHKDVNALSTVKTEGKDTLNPYTVSLKDKHLTVDDESAALAKLKLVKADAEGKYYITSEVLIDDVVTPVYLSTKQGGSALLFVTAKDEFSTWEIETGDDGFKLKNTNAVYTVKDNEGNVTSTKPQYVQYYNAFTTFSYNAKKADAYTFNAYTFPKEVKPVEEPSKLECGEDVLPIAQWGGNAPYDKDLKAINGDLYATNDMLDTNAVFKAVVGGEPKQPFLTSKGKTASTNYYMGATGLGSGSNDYAQFELSTKGYGNLSMAFRLKGSDSGASSYQLQYSKDGKNFKNFASGNYHYKYYSYAVKKDVEGKGTITDGKAPIKQTENYTEYSFDVPNGAANAEKLYIRLVPSDTRAKITKNKDGKELTEIGKTSTFRIDSVSIKGNPIVGKDVVAFVKADPVAGEIFANQKITLSTGTEGATIHYSINGGGYKVYDAENKISLKELPSTISAYATKEGLTDSITVRHQYTQAQVLSVKATPNGGAIASTQKVTLKTKTEGATILYRYRTLEEIQKDEAKQSQSENKTESEESSDSDDDPEPADNDWITYEGAFELKELPAQIQVKAVKEGYLDSAVKTLKFTKRENDKYGIYFGQIHAHTSISDGAGTLEEALQHASKVNNLDYIVITDHSNSIDNYDSSKITENVDKSENDEWTYAHNLVKKYTTDKFTCAYGYEMTWSNGLGHMNTFNTPGFQSRTQSEYSTYSTALNNYYAALRTVPDSISQFNHPGTTFGDFQDFAYYSEENDNLITMIEVGNGEGTIGSSGYFPSYEYYTRALDKGWHVAPTNNQDNHKGRWGDANTARTVMLADVNNEDAIYDAMRNYRIYATEDNDLSIYYTLNDNIMGTILEKEDVGDTVELKAEIKDPTDSKIGKVEVIVNGGMSIASQNVDKSEATVTFEVPSSYSYYYLKITEADKDIAVTAPVWVGKVEACGINKTYTNTVLPVKGEALDINVDFFNNEKADLEINNINIVVKDVDKNETEVVNLSGEQAGVTVVKSQGTAAFKTDFIYNAAGQVTYEVVVNATLNGVPKIYNDKLQVNYSVPEMVGDIIIDGTHYNNYVAGNYAGKTAEFTALCAKENIRATVVTDKITPEMLKNAKALVLSAPATQNDKNGNYKISHYEDDFVQMVADYAKNGGTVIVCGNADYKDSTDCQTATEQNKILEAIGSTIRMNSDEAWDDVNHGGAATECYRLYPNVFNKDAALMKGIKDGQTYSQYSGCSVDITNAEKTDFVDKAEWLVKGMETTYSVDCKGPNGKKYDANKPLDNKGNVVFIASQNTTTKDGRHGQIIVAGGAFFSDFEVKAEMDNNDSLPYANYTITKNIIDSCKTELPVTKIADVRKAQMNEVFAVEGYVTSGTDNENTTFFDTIYLQDETGGIDIFPYATPGLAIGTKMRIVGYVAQYQGDLELKVLSTEILDAEPYVWEAKKVSTKEAMNYDDLGGSLLNTTGKVTRVQMASDGKTVEEFWLQDGTGVEAAIFIDGYINSATTGKNELADFVKVGEIISATGVLYKHPEGTSEVSVPVFRVRNCDDIQLGKEEDVMPGEEVPTPQPSETPSTQPTVVEKIVQGITNFVSSVVKAIQESPIVNALKNLFGLGTTNTNTNTNTNNNRPTRTAAANVVPEEAPAEEETPAVEVTPEAPASEEAIADEETPLAAVAENNTTEKSFPVVPVTAGSVIILAGAGLFIKKKGLLGK